jgi:predicted GNAT family N-acyltransferase
MKFEIKTVLSSQLRDLRFKVLWPHKPGPEQCVLDIDDLHQTRHFAALEGDRIVAIATVFPEASPRLKQHRQFRLRAMASDPDYRGSGAAAQVVRSVLQYVKQEGGEVLWCDARLKAVGFYERLGFRAEDDVYVIPIIGEHKFMWIVPA